MEYHDVLPKYLYAGLVFMHKIWLEELGKIEYNYMYNSDLDDTSLASFCQRMAEQFSNRPYTFHI